MDKLRVAQYCRVSTKTKEQTQSIDRQEQDNEYFIMNMVHLGKWEYVGAYIDQSSGTTTKYRDSYNEMMRDMAAKKFDAIVMKSMDRGWRNLRDWTDFEAAIRTHKIQLIFRGKSAYNPKDGDEKLLTGFEALLAERFSANQSAKSKSAAAWKKREGLVSSNGKNWGYLYKNNKLTVNDDEAAMIRMIYEMCAAGVGLKSISEALFARGYRSKMSKIPNKRIHENTIRNIIRNEKYKGLLIIGKKSNDFYEKKQERMPESEWATFPGGCPAIVSEELWERANVILSKKAEDWKASVKKKGVVRDFSGRYPLSGKLICDSCGEKYYHAPMGHSGRKMIGWRCDNYARNSRKPNGCRSVRATILDDELYPTLKTAIFEHLTKNAEAIELALQLAAKALRKKAGTGGRKTTEKQIVKAEADLKAFRKKMILAAKNDDELTSYKEIETEMARELEAMKQKRMEERVHEDDTAGKINRMQLMRQELNKFADTPGTMADAALDEYVKKITVSVDGKATIYLYHVPIPAVVQLPKRVRRNAKSRPKV